MIIRHLSRVMAAAMVVLLLAPLVALADSPVGTWSGSASGAGRNTSASATFGDDGSCSLTAAGITATGSWSGGSMSISALGLTATLSYACSGNSMTISGTYLGQKGKMKLSRAGTAGTSGDADAATGPGSAGEPGAPGQPAAEDAILFGEWKRIGDSSAQTLRLYEDGWLYWREDHYPPRPSGGGGDAPALSEFAAAVSVADGQLTLTPIEGVEMGEAWQRIWGSDEGRCVLPYQIAGDKLTLQGADGQILLTADAAVKLDRKPSEPILLPHITLRQGDAGKAVRLLQQWLADNDYLHVPIDGQFGAKTQSAICAYQWVMGLDETGIADGSIMNHLTNG